MSPRNRYSKEVKDRAVRIVFESLETHGSKHATIQSIAPKIGCSRITLDKWVKQVEIDDGKRAG